MQVQVTIMKISHNLEAFEAFLMGFDTNHIEEIYKSECPSLIQVVENGDVQYIIEAVRLELQLTAAWLVEHVHLSEAEACDVAWACVHANNAISLKLVLSRQCPETIKMMVFYAMKHGHAKILRLIFDPRLHKFDKEVLKMTVTKNLEMVEFLIENKTGLENIGGALMISSSRGYSNIVELLLPHLHDREQADKFALDQSLINASKNGHARIIDMLLKAGANPLARNSKCLLVAHPNTRTLIEHF